MIPGQLLFTNVVGAIPILLCLQFKVSLRSFYGHRRQLQNAKVYPLCGKIEGVQHQPQEGADHNESGAAKSLIVLKIFYCSPFFFIFVSDKHLGAALFSAPHLKHHLDARKQGRTHVMLLLMTPQSQLSSINWSHMRDSSETALVLLTSAHYRVKHFIYWH